MTQKEQQQLGRTLWNIAEDVDHRNNFIPAVV
jgi:hypothetical protein